MSVGEEGYTILDGEIIMTDEGSGTLAATMSVAGSLPETAEAVQRTHGWARLVIFDIPMWQGNSVEHLFLEDRRQLLENLDLENYEHLFPIRCHKGIPPGEERENILQDYLMEGYEGIVLKDPTSAYRSPRAWLKLKDEVTLDVQVIGWEKGRMGGKWEQSLGALFCGVIDSRTGEMTEVCDVMPGDDSARERLFAELAPLSDDEILDRRMIIEIKGQCWTSDGKIRHPRIVRWREDRSEPNTLDLSHVFGKEWQEVAVSG
jgi:ATP-dependent DNA ligase